jgi:hypothetical protein
MADETPVSNIMKQAKEASKEANRPLQDRAFDYIEPFLEAERGDFSRVADLIERREWLPDNILTLVAEHLRGNSATPQRRTRQQLKMEFGVYCQVQDHIESGKSKYAAIKAVEGETGIPNETIKSYLSNMKKGF